MVQRPYQDPIQCDHFNVKNLLPNSTRKKSVFEYIILGHVDMDIYVSKQKYQYHAILNILLNFSKLNR